MKGNNEFVCAVVLQGGVASQLGTHISPLETQGPQVGQFCSTPSHFHFVGARRGPADTSGQVQVRFVFDLGERRKQEEYVSRVWGALTSEWTELERQP